MRDRRGCRAVLMGGAAIVLACLVYGGLAGAVLYRGEVPLYAPRVTGVEPPPGAVMAPMTTITLHFDQPMDRESVGAAFTVEPGVAGSLEWSDGDRHVTFVPAGAGFATGNRYTIRLDERAEDATLGRRLTRGIEWDLTMAPMLKESEPPPGVEGLGAYPALRAAFNYTIDCGSTFRTFTITPDAVGILGCRDQTFVFSPTVSLAPDTAYEASLAHAFVEGDPTPRPGASWSFRTAPGLTVADVRPGRAGFLIDLLEPVRVSFNRPVVAESVEGRFGVVSEEGERVQGSVSWEEGGAVLVFQPQVPWLPGTGYRINVDAGVRDELWFELEEPVTSGFGTLQMVGLPLPVPGSQEVALDSEVRVPFTRPMDRASVEAGLVLTPAVAGVYAWDEDTLVLTPVGGLAGDTQYEFRLAANVRDASGAPLGRMQRWAFATEPFLLDADVPAGAPVLSLGQPLTLTFALPMDRASVAAALAVTPDTPGDLVWDGEGRTVTFWPEPGWQAGAAYRVRLSSEARTADGGQVLGEERSWVFDTAAAEVQFGYGGGVQVIDAAGARAFQFAYQGPELISFRAHAITPTQFIELYETGGYTGALTATLAWREAVVPATSGAEAAGWQPAQAHLPPELDPGLYLISTEPPPAAPRSVQQGTLLVALTEHALLLKKTVAERAEVLAWDVTFDGAAVASATLTLHDKQGASLAAGVTSREGIVSLDVAAEPGAWLALSNAGGDVTVAGLSDEWQGADAGSGLAAREPMTYTPPAIYLYTDRPAYQPGEVVHYKALVRAGVPAPTATVGLRDPSGQISETQVLTRSAFGTVQGSLALADGAAEGTWQIELAAAGAVTQQPVAVAAAQGVEPGAAVDVTGTGSLDVDLPRRLYTSEEEIALAAHARGPDGSPVAGARVVAQIVGWDGEVVADAVADADRAGQVLLAFQLVEQGAYEVRLAATDEGGFDARSSTSLAVYDPAGEAPLYGGQWDEPGIVDVVVERAEYAAGEQARLLIYSASAGRALMTVEGDGVHVAQAITLTAGSNVLTLPVGADLAPEVEVWVHRLWRVDGVWDGQQSRPDAAFAVAMDRFQVSRADRRLAVAVACDAETYVPGAEATCRVEVVDAAGRPVVAETSVSATSAGVSRPSEGPFEALYGGRPNYVRTYHSLAPRRWLLSEPLQSADQGPALADLTGIARAESAYWAPDLVTSASGTVSFTLALPDEAATWQVVARAVTTDTRAGQAMAQLVTTETIRVEPVLLPPSLVAGEVVTLTAAIYNRTAQPVSVTLVVEAEGLAVAPVATSLPPLHVAARGVATATWPAVVAERAAGEARITFRATATQRGTRLVGRGEAEVVLPVHPGVLPQVEAFAGALTADEPQAAIIFTLPAEAISGTLAGLNRLEVRLAPSLAVAAADGYASLADPAAGAGDAVGLAAGRVLAGAALSQVLPAAAARETIERGLLQLYAAQDARGGWSWWDDGVSEAEAPGSDGGDVYQTAYALLALAAARDAGFVVDEAVVTRGADALTEWLPEAAAEIQAWGTYALLSVGAPLSPTLSPGDVRELGPAPQAALALALDAMGESEAVASLVELLRTSAVTETGDVYWQEGGSAWEGTPMGSPVAHTALALHALARLDPTSGLLAGGTRWLMAQRRGVGWATPHETALALLALGDLLRAAAPEAGAVAYRLTLNGRLWDEGQLAAGVVQTLLLTYTETVSPALLVPGDNVLGLALGGNGEAAAGPLYYAAVWTVYVPPTGGEPASDAAGLAVARAQRQPDAAERATTPHTEDAVALRLPVGAPQAVWPVVPRDRLAARFAVAGEGGWRVMADQPRRSAAR